MGIQILVCLGTSPTNQKVIRTASKMAQAFHGEFIALYVDSKELDYKALEQLKKTSRLLKNCKRILYLLMVMI